MNNYKTMTHDRLIAVARAIQNDHAPDGWPAVQTALLTEFADRLERMQAMIEGHSVKIADFMARTAEGEADADNLATAVKEVMTSFAYKAGHASEPVWFAACRTALGAHHAAYEWRNGVALNRYKAALKPFADAHEKWHGGNAQGYFATAVCPADFRAAALALNPPTP